MMRAALCCALMLPLGDGGSASPPPLPAVVPQPLSLVVSGGSVTLDTAFGFVVSGGEASSTLEAALKRFSALLHDDDSSAATGDATLASCAVTVRTPSLELSASTDESYSLTVATDSCAIESPTVYGAMHGMETFVQLVRRANRSVPTVVVTDRPRFAFRAAMIDTARHWLPIQVILQHLDAMGATKMNVLHWHLVDSQSFPYVSTAFPQLSEHGAYGKAEVYTADDIKRVAQYAQERGIRIIPEVDTPGHVWAGLAAMTPPVLTDCIGTDGSVVGTGPMDPSKETTFSFLETLLKEVVPLFGSSSFMVGGDEVPHDCWASNPAVVEFVRSRGWGSDMGKLERYYNQRLQDILAAQNTSVMCWEEVFQSGVALRNDSLVNVWSGGWEWCEKPTSGSACPRTNATCNREYGSGGPWFGKMHVRDNSWAGTMSRAATAGHKTVLSSPFYLNAENGGSNFDEVWPWYYTIEPTAFEANHTGSDIPLTAEEREASVEGVEACMWSSWVDRSNFLPRFWPTAAAVAERGWAAKTVTSIDDFRRRLHAVSCELQARGLPSSPPIFAGSFFHANGTVCENSKGGVSVMSPAAPGCLPRFSSCADHE